MMYLKLYADMEDLFSPYTDEEKGRLFSAMMAYAYHSEEPDFSGNEKYIWPALKRHMDACADVSESMRENGRRGGKQQRNAEPESKEKQTQANESKKKQTQANESKEKQTQANESQKEKEKEQEQEQEQKKENEKRKSETPSVTADAAAPSPRGKAESAFEDFWAAYPRKTARQEALKAFIKLSPDEQLLKEMHAALVRQKQSPQWREEDGRFIPHAATWLHQRRWEDILPSGGGKTVNAQQYTQREYAEDDLISSEARALINAAREAPA